MSNDPKTTDYCSICNQSPESGTHMFEHDYVAPTIVDVCGCGRSRGSDVHAPGAVNGRRWYPLKTPPIAAAIRAAIEGQPIRVDSKGRVITAPSLMRVMVDERPGMPQFGVLVGMMLDERGDMQVVVRPDGYGMMLKAVHPSKVTPVTPDQEEAYKP